MRERRRRIRRKILHFEGDRDDGEGTSCSFFGASAEGFGFSGRRCVPMSKPFAFNFSPSFL